MAVAEEAVVDVEMEESSWGWLYWVSGEVKERGRVCAPLCASAAAAER